LFAQGAVISAEDTEIGAASIVSVPREIGRVGKAEFVPFDRRRSIVGQRSLVDRGQCRILRHGHLDAAHGGNGVVTGQFLPNLVFQGRHDMSEQLEMLVGQRRGQMVAVGAVQLQAF